jgi:hypothetical protein
MNYDQFVTAVRDRGEYPDRSQAEEVTTWVLEVLARRLTREEVDDQGQVTGAVPAQPSPVSCREDRSLRPFSDSHADVPGRCAARLAGPAGGEPALPLTSAASPRTVARGRVCRCPAAQ